jgi:hypothetical protein
MDTYRCTNPTHTLPMTLRPVANQTPEQRWCGEWYDCADPRCRSSLLIPSEELNAHLATQCAANASPERRRQLTMKLRAGK